ncbi:MAG: hypothetical protein V2A62_05555 [Candidatus Woesearchaeota archaeon]
MEKNLQRLMEERNRLAERVSKEILKVHKLKLNGKNGQKKQTN